MLSMEMKAEGCYRVAGLDFRIVGTHRLTGYLDEYRIPERDAALQVTVRKVPRLSLPQGTEVYGDSAFRVYRSGAETIRYIGSVNPDPCGGHLRSSLKGTQMAVEFSGVGEITDKMVLRAMDFPHLLTGCRGFLLHASFIEYEGKGILFTAPSGTGKSTQASLWCAHGGAVPVNGDRAAVRITEDGVLACGVPFSGSSPDRRNVTVPLAAIVYLSQAPENRISRLRGARAFRRVWEGCAADTWDRHDVDLTAAAVTDAVSRIPVWHLACTPDERAVQLLKQTMEVER